MNKKTKQQFSDNPTTQRSRELYVLRRQILEKRLKSIRRTQETGLIEVTQSPRSDDPVLASFVQRRLWYLQQLALDSPVYNAYRTWRLTGTLNLKCFQRALQTLVSRHDALRTTFRLSEGELFQIVNPSQPLSFSMVDLRNLPPEQRDVECRYRISAEVRRPFALAQGPLLRVVLIQTAGQEYIFVLNMHHIVTDGWSVALMVREITGLYNAYLHDKPSPLRETSLQYTDYAVWERDMWRRNAWTSSLDFWRTQFADGLPAVQLPTDRPRPPTLSFRGARQSFHISRTLTRELRTLARRANATLFMVLLAAFYVLLHRYTGQKRLAVGSPVANRPRPEVESLIGVLVNTLALSIDVSGNPSFLELISRVRAVTLPAYDHQGLPFEKLVEELEPNRDQSRNPIFQIMFVLQSTPRETLNLAGLKSIAEFDVGSVIPFTVDNGTSKVDLTMAMMQRGSELHGFMEYSTVLFESTTIQRTVGHFQTLLEATVTNPDAPISKLGLLTDREWC